MLRLIRVETIFGSPLKKTPQQFFRGLGLIHSRYGKASLTSCYLLISNKENAVPRANSVKALYSVLSRHPRPHFFL